MLVYTLNFSRNTPGRNKKFIYRAQVVDTHANMHEWNFDKLNEIQFKYRFEWNFYSPSSNFYWFARVFSLERMTKASKFNKFARNEKFKEQVWNSVIKQGICTFCFCKLCREFFSFTRKCRFLKERVARINLRNSLNLLVFWLIHWNFVKRYYVNLINYSSAGILLSSCSSLNNFGRKLYRVANSEYIYMRNFGNMFS